MGDDPSRGRRRGEAALRRLVGALAFAFLGLGVARAAMYLWYAAGMLAFPLESHQLEAKMVLMAYRAQAGLSLYPEWREYPHVANFFAPLDFLLVGWVGRLVRADLRGLFLIGRAASFASGLIATMILGVWAGRRYGRGAGLVAAILSLGARPMDGFSIATRPDMPAELLGLVGFLLTGARAGGWKAAGVGALVLAAFTKQTAAVYLVAAALALAWEGRRDWAMGVLGGGLGAIGLVVAGVTLAVEPNFARGLVGEASTPWDLRAWSALMRRMAIGGPDVLLLPALGLVAWTAGRDRSPRLAALAAVPMAAALVASMKRGADVNYFLPLRPAGAMAAAMLWSAARGDGPARRSPATAAAMASAVVSVALSTLVMAFGLMKTREILDTFAGPRGEQALSLYRALARLAADPSGRLLTDSGFIDAHAKDRAVFGDPWLFRMLVETGRIDPEVLVGRIESGYYAVIATTSDLRRAAYEAREAGLPMALVGPIRRRYDLIGADGGLFLYMKKEEARAAGGDLPIAPR